MTPLGRTALSTSSRPASYKKNSRVCGSRSSRATATTARVAEPTVALLGRGWKSCPTPLGVANYRGGPGDQGEGTTARPRGFATLRKTGCREVEGRLFLGESGRSPFLGGSIRSLSLGGSVRNLSLGGSTRILSLEGSTQTLTLGGSIRGLSLVGTIDRSHPLDGMSLRNDTMGRATGPAEAVFPGEV